MNNSKNKNIQRSFIFATFATKKAISIVPKIVKKSITNILFHFNL